MALFEKEEQMERGSFYNRWHLEPTKNKSRDETKEKMEADGDDGIMPIACHLFSGRLISFLKDTKHN